MSNTTKIVIGVAVIALLAYGVYWYLTQPQTQILSPQDQQLASNTYIASANNAASTAVADHYAGVPIWGTIFS